MNGLIVFGSKFSLCFLFLNLNGYNSKSDDCVLFATPEENVEEPFEPEEQTKLEMRRQKQAARSAQVIYVLQQQVLII